MKPTEDRDRPAPRGFLGRFRELPGSRTAVVAFVLTVVLGIGGTAAYALWSQTGNANISVVAGAAKPTPPPTTPPTPTPTTPPTTPAPTTPTVGPNPVLSGLPGKPTAKPVNGDFCVPTEDKAGMANDTVAEYSFNWLAPTTGTTPTGYVVRVTSTSSEFAYDQVQTVTATSAKFMFPRSPSRADNFHASETSTPYYTRYTVRVMPMNGTVAGDPQYWTFQYAHEELNNCWPWADTQSGLGTVGNTAITCPVPPLQVVDKYSTLALSWRPAAGATAYRLTILSKGKTPVQGLELTTTDTQTVLRFAQATASNGEYTVRVQPMNASGAGDPAYITYNLWGSGHNCW